MKFTDDIRCEILKYLSGNGDTPTGHVCRFFTIGEIGVKVYGEKHESAKRAYEIQERASQLGLGPAVGDYWEICLRLGAGRHISIYGYLTQIADTSEYFEHWQCKELHADMKKHGFPDWDTFGGNVGTIDGKLVCLDFEPVSMKHME